MALKDRQQPASTIDDKISRRLHEQRQRQQQNGQVGMEADNAVAVCLCECV